MTRHEIGTDGPPVGEFSHGTCKGAVHPELKGEGALVSFNSRNQFVVQFDNQATGFGAGWHSWDGRDFERDVDDFPQFNVPEEEGPVSQDGGPMHASCLRVGFTGGKLDNY